MSKFLKYLAILAAAAFSEDPYSVFSQNECTVLVLIISFSFPSVFLIIYGAQIYMSIRTLVTICPPKLLKLLLFVAINSSYYLLPQIIHEHILSSSLN